MTNAPVAHGRRRTAHTLWHRAGFDGRVGQTFVCIAIAVIIQSVAYFFTTYGTDTGAPYAIDTR